MRARAGALLLGFTLVLSANAVRAQAAWRSGTIPDFDIAAALQYGSVRLEPAEVVQRALTHPDVRRAEALRRSAVAAAGAASAALWPRLELSLGHTHLSETVITDPRFLGLEDFTDRTAGRAQLSLPVTQTLLVNLANRRAAAASAGAAAFDSRGQQAQLAVQAVEALYGFARARAQMLVAQLDFRAAEQHVAEALQLKTAGRVGATDILSAQTRAGEARLGWIEAQGRVGVASAALARLLGSAIPADAAISEDVGQVPALRVDLQGLLQQGRRTRPELQALRSRVGARSADLLAARGSRLPALALTAGIDLGRPQPRAYPTVNAFGVAWDVGVALRWSPNDTVAGGYETAGSGAVLTAVEAELSAMERSVDFEISQAWTELTARSSSVEPARENLAVAEQNYKAHDQLFQSGTISSRELSTIAADLRHARLAFVELAIGARIAWARLQHASGSLLASLARSNPRPR